MHATRRGTRLRQAARVLRVEVLVSRAGGFGLSAGRMRARGGFGHRRPGRAGLGGGRLPEGVEGIARFHELAGAHADEPGEVVIGIETHRGLVRHRAGRGRLSGVRGEPDVYLSLPGPALRRRCQVRPVNRTAGRCRSSGGPAVPVADRRGVRKIPIARPWQPCRQPDRHGNRTYGAQPPAQLLLAADL